MGKEEKKEIKAEEAKNDKAPVWTTHHAIINTIVDEKNYCFICPYASDLKSIEKAMERLLEEVGEAIVKQKEEEQKKKDS